MKENNDGSNIKFTIFRHGKVKADFPAFCTSKELNFPLPTIIWTMMARIQWFYDSPRQYETRKQTKARAEELIDWLESRQNTDYEKSCSLVSHGFFMLTLHRRLKRRGYKLKGIPRHSDEGYRNLQSFHASRL